MLQKFRLALRCLMILGVTFGTISESLSQEASFRWEPLTVEKLSNGLTVIVKENHSAPLVVSDIWFGVGSRNETSENNGVAHFLEHTLFKGTKNRGVGQIAKDIESFGGRTNAATSLDYTHYYILCESAYISNALEIQADVFHNSTLLGEVIDSERPVILEEIKRGEDDPHKMLWNTLMTNMYSNLPYKRTIIGPRENISTKISREEMLQFFRTWYGPNNMTIVIVGDINAKVVIEKVKSLFGDLSPSPLPDQSFGAEPELKAIRIVRKEMDVKNEYLLMAFRTVTPKQEEDLIGLDLLGAILGEGRTSRLSASLKENRGLVTQVSANHLTLIDDGLFLIKAEFDPIDETEVLEGIREEIR
ncbi:insulinase family protein, partial [bacterium]|nr:insulinase family protein [bacterium]